VFQDIIAILSRFVRSQKQKFEKWHWNTTIMQFMSRQ